MQTSAPHVAPPLFAKVLLLEDDPAHALLIRRALKGLVENVEHRDTLAAAVTEARRGGFDLIITDLNVPDASAAATVGKLREVASGAPVVVLTSSNSLRDAVEAMRLGAHDFLVKDFDSDFREVVGFALSRLHVQRVLEAEKIKLEREMQALRAAIESSADGLAVADATGVITYANSAFREFSHHLGGDTSHVKTLVGPSVPQRERILRSIEEKSASLAPGAVWTTEIALAPGSQAAFDVSLSVVSGGTEQDRSRRLVIWTRDIQDRKRREKFQREILSTTTHDLKGPLGAILLSAELITAGGLSPDKVRELVLRIASSAQSAVNLIDEFLSARRIQEGAFILKPQLVDVIASAHSVVLTFSAIAQARSISVEERFPGDRLEWKVDRLGFERTLGNLLSNALKFTPKGGRVQVSLGVEEGRLHLRVHDSGSGMEPGEVSRLFQRFARLAKHGDVAGTGLGLFVVKNVVAAHGGTIDVTSQTGAGTVFDIAFPEAPPVNERGELIALDFA